MSQYDLVAGDSGSTLRVTIKDSVTKDAIDLTGKSVKLLFSISEGATQERTMTPLNQTTNTGQADYLFTSSDLVSAGELRGEVRLQEGLADQITTVDTFYLRIKLPMA